MMEDLLVKTNAQLVMTQAPKTKMNVMCPGVVISNFLIRSSCIDGERKIVVKALPRFHIA